MLHIRKRNYDSDYKKYFRSITNNIIKGYVISTRLDLNQEINLCVLCNDTFSDLDLELINKAPNINIYVPENETSSFYAKKKFIEANPELCKNIILSSKLESVHEFLRKTDKIFDYFNLDYTTNLTLGTINDIKYIFDNNLIKDGGYLNITLSRYSHSNVYMAKKGPEYLCKHRTPENQLKKINEILAVSGWEYEEKLSPFPLIYPTNIDKKIEELEDKLKLQTRIKDRNRTKNALNKVLSFKYILDNENDFKGFPLVNFTKGNYKCGYLGNTMHVFSMQVFKNKMKGINKYV